MRSLISSAICLATFTIAHRPDRQRREAYNTDQLFRYSCKNVCNTSAPEIDTTDQWASTCSCEPSCLENNTCCPDYLVECKNKTPFLNRECSHSENDECPSDFNGKKPLILMSLDGFRIDYLDRPQAKILNKIRECGVHVPFQRSSFPTVTFPNHFSIATGLYTESHGVIDNSFQDTEIQDYYNAFSSSYQHSKDPKWFHGEPIWNTVTRQGKKSATYMWPLTDAPVNNKYPSYYYNYSGDPSYNDRIVKVLNWLDLPSAERPDFIMTYMDEPDHTGHDEGPDSQMLLRDMIESVNYALNLLMEGLELRGLTNCVNIIIGADHGMSQTTKGRRSFADEHGGDGYCYSEGQDEKGVYCYTGVVARIGPALFSSGEKFDVEQEWNSFKCSRTDPENPARWKAYRKDTDLPKRLHYHSSVRVEPIVMPMDDEWYSSKSQSSSYTLLGNHGYDNLYESMRALFVGFGPSFKQGFETEYIHQNIELYNMMCHLVGVEPSGNNGTVGSMNHVLRPEFQVPIPSIGGNAVPKYETYNSNDHENCGCADEESKNQILLNLETGPDDTPLPAISSKKTHHALPYADRWTIFEEESERTVLTTYKIKKGSVVGSAVGCIRPDPRLSETSCPASVNNQMFYMHQGFSSDAGLVENLLNMDQINIEFSRFWNDLSGKFLQTWAKDDDVTVYTGPIWDKNHDNLFDEEKSGPPTHFYWIMKRGSSQDIQVMSFVLPNYIDTIDCNIDFSQSNEQQLIDLLQQHLARIRDVEQLTGFNFELGDLTIEGVQSRLFINEWADFWNEDDLINGYTPTPIPINAGLKNGCVFALVLLALSMF